MSSKSRYFIKVRDFVQLAGSHAVEFFLKGTCVHMAWLCDYKPCLCWNVMDLEVAHPEDCGQKTRPHNPQPCSRISGCNPNKK